MKNLLYIQIFIFVILSACSGYNKNSEKISNNTHTLDATAKSAEYFYTIGNDSFDKGNYQAAFELYSKAIEIDSNYTSALYNRSFIYEMNRDYEGQIKELNKVIALDTTHHNAYFYRGRAYYKLNKFEEAFKDFKHTINVNYEVSQSYIFIASAYIKLNDDNNALINLNKAVDYAPNDPKNFYERGMFLLYKKDTAKACEDFQKSKELGLPKIKINRIDSICKK